MKFLICIFILGSLSACGDTRNGQGAVKTQDEVVAELKQCVADHGGTIQRLEIKDHPTIQDICLEEILK